VMADYRAALTGTPVENHVGDLWSIMDFLNPDFLGSQEQFRRDFLVPIQAHRDPDAVEKLAHITKPFIMRRLKTDRAIISDLPDKLEMKVRSEEHTSELQSRSDLVCRLLLEKKKKKTK